MAKLKFLAVGLITATSLAAPALAAGSHVTSRHTTANAYAAAGVLGREVPAPPWSFACMNDQGPSECGEPMWAYGSPMRDAR